MDALSPGPPRPFPVLTATEQLFAQPTEFHTDMSHSCSASKPWPLLYFRIHKYYNFHEKPQRSLLWLRRGLAHSTREPPSPGRHSFSKLFHIPFLSLVHTIKGNPHTNS